MSDEPKPPNFSAMFQGIRVKSFEAERMETPEDSAHKRTKDLVEFFVKTVAPLVIAYLFNAIMGGYCCVVVATHGVTSPEAKVVMPLLTSLFGGVIGLAFGQSMK